MQTIFILSVKMGSKVKTHWRLINRPPPSLQRTIPPNIFISMSTCHKDNNTRLCSCFYRNLISKCYISLYNEAYVKEISFCHRLKSFNPYIFSTRFRRPYHILNTNTYVKINSQSLKYQRSSWPSDCNDVGIRKFKFPTKI